MGGGADQGGDPVAVLEGVLDEEVIFGTGVGRGFDGSVDERAAGGGGFDEELVVADEGDDLAVAIEGEFAEHFFEGDVAGASHLVREKINEILVCSHGASAGKKNLEPKLHPEEPEDGSSIGLKGKFVQGNGGGLET